MENLLSDTILLVAVSLAAIILCRFANLSPIIGYIFAGLILGPNVLALISETHNIIFLAELGIVFLMFMVGLHFSLPTIIDSRRIVFLGGGLQVVICILFPLVVTLLLGVSVTEAIIISGALAMSSTALVLKQISDQNELNTVHGRSSLGILLFQDLATLPFLIAIAASAQKGNMPVYDIFWGITRAIFLFIILYFIGHFVLTRFVEWVVNTKSTELRLLTILSIIFGASYIAHIAGASLPIGAFLAGMVVGETNFKQEIENDIRLFREVLLGLFFFTVGMTLSPLIIVNHIVPILIMILFLVIGKIIIITLILKSIGRNFNNSLRSAFCLSQGGEFGLLIATVANDHNVLNNYFAQGLISAIVISMVIAPLIIKYNKKLSSLTLSAIKN